MSGCQYIYITNNMLGDMSCCHVPYFAEKRIKQLLLTNSKLEDQ